MFLRAEFVAGGEAKRTLERIKLIFCETEKSKGLCSPYRVIISAYVE